jgi:2-oxo-4-hydroxy-4-carboxy--5-ureidoimidazoline (OHCU) decarboxylase
LEADPAKTTNLIDAHPDVARRLEQQLKTTLEEGYWKS